VGKKLKCGLHSGKVVQLCIKHSFKLIGNGSVINHTREFFQ